MSLINSAQTTSVDFHAILKSRTDAAHRRLESLPISAALVSDSLTVGQYKAYLQAMQKIHRAAEEQLFPLLTGLIPDLALRKKSRLIDMDLGSQPGEACDLFESATPEFAFGIMYVLEGSTLGGRYILNNVRATLGLTAGSGAEYFSGYGDKTGSMWKSFLKAMQQFQEDNGCADEISNGAEYGFNLVHDELSKCQFQ